MKDFRKPIFSLILGLMFIVLAFQTANSISDYKTRLNQMNPVAKAVSLGDYVEALGSIVRGESILTDGPTMAIGTTANTSIKLGGFKCFDNGLYYGTASANEVALTATTHDVDSAGHASFRVSFDAADTTFTITMSDSDGYGTLAQAVAAVPSTPAGEVNLGYFTISADSNAFDATTDSLSNDDFTVGYNAATEKTIDLDS